MSLSISEVLKDIPYAQTLNIYAEEKDDDIIFYLPFKEHFIGNFMIQAYHGGVLCSFLEIAASAMMRQHLKLSYMPKIINANYNFLKPAFKHNKVYAKAKIIKKGKRIISISATAHCDQNQDVLTILHANFLNKGQN